MHAPRGGNMYMAYHVRHSRLHTIRAHTIACTCPPSHACQGSYWMTDRPFAHASVYLYFGMAWSVACV